MRLDQGIKKQKTDARRTGLARDLPSSVNRDEIAGKYAIEKDLGSGSWGSCYRAVITDTNDVVSLRILARDFSKRELASIQSAIRFTSVIESGRFQHAVDASNELSNAYVSSQYIPGEDLYRLVKRTGRLPVRQSIYCIARAIEGLSEAHKKGVVHGELRPSKIIVDRSGAVTIRDIALAQVTRMRRKFATEPTQIQNLPRQHLEYLAPEILSGLLKPNFSTDLYSLGCILFFLLTGKPPYVCKNVNRTVKAHHEAAIPRASRHVKGIPPSLDECLARMLAKQPADRFANYKQCHEALRDIAKSLPNDDRSPKEQWDQIVDVDKSESVSWWNGPSSVASKRLTYSAFGIVLLVGIGLSFFYFLRPSTTTNLTVEPGDGKIPTAESEDSFIIR